MKLVKKIIKKLYHLIWFLSAFFLFSKNAYAYDFGHWKGAELTTFNYRLSNNHWVSSSTNAAFTWLNHPSFDGSPFADFYQISATYHISSTTINPGNASFQFALGYIDDGQTGYEVCTFISRFNRYVLDYSSDGNNYDHLVINSYSCAANSGFIILTYNVTISSQINFSYLASGIQSDSILSNPFSTLFSAVNILSDSEGSDTIINQNQIIINQNQQSIDIQNEIRNSIDNSSSQIIQNQDSNTQDIISNQNENADKQIDSQKVCKNIDKSFAPNKSFLNANGQLSNSNSSVTTNFFSINSSTTLKVLQVASSGTYRTCFYDINKNFISCLTNSDLVVNSNVSFPTGSAYFRSTISVNENKPTFEYCQSGNQALNDSVNDLNDSITNDDPPDIDLNLNEASDTPISDLLTMPLTILNTLITNLSDSCSNYTIPFFFNTSVTFPCFTLSDYLGSTVTNYIDLFICLYMCYNIAMLCISVFDDITSLNDIFNSLYTPRHAYTGYKPKHGGD